MSLLLVVLLFMSATSVAATGVRARRNIRVPQNRVAQRLAQARGDAAHFAPGLPGHRVRAIIPPPGTGIVPTTDCGCGCGGAGTCRPPVSVPTSSPCCG